MANDSTPLQSAFPESPDPDLEKYRLRSPTEIGRILRDLSKGGDLLTAYFNGNEFFLTSLLGMDTEERRLYLDYSPDDRLNNRVLQAGPVLFVGRHYQVRVQFQVPGLSRVMLKDGPAFAAPFPDSVLRIQRREFYRLTTPIALRPICRLTLDNGTMLQTAIVDISLGGIGVIESSPEHEPIWTPGNVLKGAVIELPEEARILSDIEIRNRYVVTQPNGQKQIHIGCKFLHLEPRMNADIQRYIHRIDLERRRLLRE